VLFRRAPAPQYNCSGSACTSITRPSSSTSPSQLPQTSRLRADRAEFQFQLSDLNFDAAACAGGFQSSVIVSCCIVNMIDVMGGAESQSLFSRNNVERACLQWLCGTFFFPMIFESAWSIFNAKDIIGHSEAQPPHIPANGRLVFMAQPVFGPQDPIVTAINLREYRLWLPIVPGAKGRCALKRFKNQFAQSPKSVRGPCSQEHINHTSPVC